MKSNQAAAITFGLSAIGMMPAFSFAQAQQRESGTAGSGHTAEERQQAWRVKDRRRVYYAPSLNGDVIKQVVSNPGSALTSEPASISLGQRAAETLQHKSYPVVKMPTSTTGSGARNTK